MPTATTVPVKMAQRRDTAANWTSANPTLLAGEIGIESDTLKWKVGTGSTAWTSLGYIPAFSLSAYPLVNADIAAAAAIAYSKLATLTSGNIVLGSSANVATSTAVTGDVTISNTGVTAIATGVIVNADINASAAIVDTKLATIATAGKVSNSATTAASANTASAIVARDASGNFSAGTITADLTGNASTVTTNANLTGDVTSVGNATSIATGVIVDADINASAAIAGSKIVAATTSVVGAVQLSDSTSTTSSVLAATPTAVKAAYDLADAALPKAGGTVTGNVILDNQVDARFREATANGTNYVGFQAPATIAADVLWTLPAVDGTAGQVISTNGTGTLSWASAASGDVTLTGTQTLTNKTLTSPILTTPALGTPSSGTLTSCTGLPISTGVSGLGTGAATFLATPSSANFAALLTDETGTGANVFATSPTISNPTVTGDVIINAQGDLRLADADSSNWVAFQAPATVAANVTWTLPATDGTSNQVLKTDGAGTLSWTTPTAGVSLGLVIALS